MGNRGRPRKPPTPPAPDEPKRRKWWLKQLARIQKAVDAAEPETADFGRLLVNAGICESKLKDLKNAKGVEALPKPAVASRPKTKLDKAGPPK